MGLFSKKDQQTLTYSIPDMHCDNCQRKVKGLVDSLPGVLSAQTDGEKQTLTVGLSAGASTKDSEIREKLQAGGYPAQ